jgi:hypothetical protein
VPPQVEPQRGCPGLTKPSGQPGEEPALLPRDTAPVNQDDRAAGWPVGAGERPGQVQAIEGVRMLTTLSMGMALLSLKTGLHSSSGLTLCTR